MLYIVFKCHCIIFYTSDILRSGFFIIFFMYLLFAFPYRFAIYEIPLLIPSERCSNTPAFQQACYSVGCMWQTTVKTGLVSFSLNEQIAKSANTDCVKSLLMISSSKPTNGNVHLHRVLINFLPLKNVSWHEVHRLSVSSSFIYRFISALFLIKLTVLLLKT